MPNPINHFADWTRGAHIEILQRYRRRESIRDIASVTGRTNYAIVCQLVRLAKAEFLNAEGYTAYDWKFDRWLKYILNAPRGFTNKAVNALWGKHPRVINIDYETPLLTSQKETFNLAVQLHFASREMDLISPKPIHFNFACVERKKDMNEEFYMVESANVRKMTLKEARKKAEQLVRENPDLSFYVMKAVSRVELGTVAETPLKAKRNR